MIKIRLELPWPVTELWPNRSNGRHWSVRSDAAKSARRFAHYTTNPNNNHYGLSPTPLEVTYEFCPPTRRRFDLEGAYSAMKPSQDGIADGLEVDDSLFNPVILKRGEVVPKGKVIITILS